MTLDPLSATFAALADPTRRAILARLTSGDCSVSELAEPFDMSLPAVSKHLRVLERAGLISRSREAQWRPCRLEPRRLEEAAAWAERTRAAWRRRLDRLDAYLHELVAKTPQKPNQTPKPKPKPKQEEKSHGRQPRSK